MRIQHNITALNSYRNLTTNNNAVSKNLEKLSSGYRINRAGDDAAGLAISEKMRAQITGLETAQKNANDGISLIQTAEGALTEVHSMLNRMVELADQSANGTYQDEVDRENLQKEMDSLKEEVNRISKSANFNGINLLDGSLSEHPAATVESTTISSTAGVNLNQGTNGAGSKGEFSINLDEAFGTGDTIKLDGLDADGNAITQTFTFGTDFDGDTVEEQAQSLASKLNTSADFAGNFDISVDGSKITLTSKTEGAAATAGNAGSAVISVVTPSDKTVTLGAITTTPSAASTQGYEGGINAMIGTGATGTGTGINVEAGNAMEFEFSDGNGNTLKASVEITQDMIDANPTQDALTTAIVNKLNNTKFSDVAGTAADESTLKVSDLFDLTANKNAADAAENGAIEIKGKAGVMASASKVTVYTDATKSTSRGNITATQTTAATAGTAGKIEVAAGTNNFTAGDRITINGTLSDGKSFSVDMVAGRDFAIGASYNDSITDLAKQLNDGNVHVTVDGSTKVSSDQVFGANKDFTLTGAAGKIEITSNLKTDGGKGKAGVINSIVPSTANAADATFTKKDAVAQGYAGSSVEISKDIGYGAAIKVGDTTFEVVKDARDVTSRNNVAVVISDLEGKSAADIAKAISDAAVGTSVFTNDKAMDADNDGTVTDAERTAAKNAGFQYAVSVDGNKLTFTTLEKGSSVDAPKLGTPYGDKIPVKNVKFDPKKLSYGDEFSVDGKNYQFVKNLDDVKDGNIGVIVDLATATSKDVGDAIADVAQGVKATVEEDGTVSFQSMAGADGTVSAPKFVFESKGLSLQVGDTAEDYQKVNVKVGAMNSQTLGLDAISISTQTEASKAIDVIKDAINTVSSTRGDLGAVQNRLEHTINNLSVTTENMTAAESRIRDVDMAKEMMAYTKNNILVQASQAMLAQANQVPQGVLQLLQ